MTDTPRLILLDALNVLQYLAHRNNDNDIAEARETLLRRLDAITDWQNVDKN